MIRDLIRAMFPEAGEQPSLLRWCVKLALRFVFKPGASLATLKAVKTRRRAEAAKNDLYPLW